MNSLHDEAVLCEMLPPLPPPSFLLLLCLLPPRPSLSRSASQPPHPASPPSQTTPPLAPVLVPAVPDGRHEVSGAPRHSLNVGQILRRQLQLGAAAAQAFGHVTPRARHAKPAADDDSAHCGPIQHVARSHAGQRAATPLGNAVEGEQEVLEEAPPPPRVHHRLVLAEGGGGQLRPGARLCLSQIALREQTPG